MRACVSSCQSDSPTSKLAGVWIASVAGSAVNLIHPRDRLVGVSLWWELKRAGPAQPTTLHASPASQMVRMSLRHVEQIGWPDHR